MAGFPDPKRARIGESDAELLAKLNAAATESAGFLAAILASDMTPEQAAAAGAAAAAAAAASIGSVSIAQSGLEDELFRALGGVPTMSSGASVIGSGMAMGTGAPAVGSGASAPLERSGQGVSKIESFLARLGLHHYLKVFIDNGFDTMTAVEAMDEEEMREDIGMAEDHIRFLMQALRSGDSVVSAAPLELDFMSPTANWNGCSFDASTPTATWNASTPTATWNASTPTAHWSANLMPTLPPATSSTASMMPAPNLMHAQVPAGILAMRRRNAGAPPAAPMMADSQLSAGWPHPSTVMQPGFLSMGATIGQPMQHPGGCGGGAVIGPPKANLPSLGQGSVIGPPPISSVIGAHAAAGNQDTSLFALAQLAEESAQMVASASSFCANPQELSQVGSVSEAAESALERAKWAAKTVDSMGPPEPQVDEWLTLMRKVTHTCAEVAEKAFNVCKLARDKVEELMPGTVEKRSKVPCRFFIQTGTCRDGAACRLSHDPKDQEARPLMMKRQEICRFYENGQCIRGVACAWAHGQAELEEITKYVAKLRDEKHQLKRQGRTPHVASLESLTRR